MATGHIVAADREVYRVRPTELTNTKELLCRARGVFRDKSITPVVGDLVEVEEQGDKGWITKVYPRKNLLFRPPVANIDQVLVVQTLREPDINALSFDKLLAVLGRRGLDVILCFNKIDRAPEDQLREWVSKYRAIGYPTFSLNALTGHGLDELLEELRGKITAIAGPSGAGKSTLIRRITGDERAVSGKISEKTARGKQTTRRVEMFGIDSESFIFDTPGFSSLDLRDFESGLQLGETFPEIERLAGECRFRNCTHRKEPDCAVRRAAESGEIDPQRYKNYLQLFEEVESKRRY